MKTSLSPGTIARVKDRCNIWRLPWTDMSCSIPGEEPTFGFLDVGDVVLVIGFMVEDTGNVGEYLVVASNMRLGWVFAPRLAAVK